MKNHFHLDIQVALATLLGWVAVGTLMFHYLEPWSWIDSFYFSVVTITTVGYGDLTPSSDISRLFTAIYILIGVSIGLVSLGIIGSGIIRNRQENIQRYRNKYNKKN